MKFNIIFSTKEDRFERELEGDLDMVKTFVKLQVGNKFTWGAVQQIDELEQGCVERWFMRKNVTTSELELHAFSFYQVDPIININAMQSAFEYHPGMNEISKLLGGGKF